MYAEAKTQCISAFVHFVESTIDREKNIPVLIFTNPKTEIFVEYFEEEKRKSS
jgi:hypothetical protein